MAWDVVAEGKGIDWVLEIVYRADREEALVTKVQDYARLGIPEYFIYDRRNQRLIGHRLPRPTATRYEPIRSRLGRLKSEVLGLDLGIVEGKLRFFYGEAEIPESRELVARLTEMMDESEQRWEEAEARLAEEAAARAAAEARADAAERDRDALAAQLAVFLARQAKDEADR